MGAGRAGHLGLNAQWHVEEATTCAHAPVTTLHLPTEVTSAWVCILKRPSATSNPALVHTHTLSRAWTQPTWTRTHSHLESDRKLHYFFRIGSLCLVPAFLSSCLMHKAARGGMKAEEIKMSHFIQKQMVKPSLRYEDNMHKPTAGSAGEEGKIRRLMTESNLAHWSTERWMWEESLYSNVSPSISQNCSEVTEWPFISCVQVYLSHHSLHDRVCSCTVQPGDRGRDKWGEC